MALSAAKYVIFRRANVYIRLAEHYLCRRANARMSADVIYRLFASLRATVNSCCCTSNRKVILDARVIAPAQHAVCSGGPGVRKLENLAIRSRWDNFPRLFIGALNFCGNYLIDVRFAARSARAKRKKRESGKRRKRGGEKKARRRRKANAWKTRERMSP